jgi:hypothetical protein
MAILRVGFIVMLLFVIVAIVYDPTEIILLASFTGLAMLRFPRLSQQTSSFPLRETSRHG